jgi:predicted transposase YbfD/YdcC
MMAETDVSPGWDVPRDRVALLLKHFSRLDDGRVPWRIAYRLDEVLLLLTCATIASCDDFDDIAAWGETHLDFLRGFAPFYNGVPCERWLRTLVNRVDPALFGRCFEDWIKAMWPGRHDHIAIDGKTARRSHDKAKGLKALHTLSAYASNARLTLACLSVPEKTNEITAIPDLLDHLAATGQLKGALVTIDAMGCQTAIAEKIAAHGAEYLLALKGNHPAFEAEVASYFATAPAEELAQRTTVEKAHGRIETRITSASAAVDWITGPKQDPGQPRFRHIKTLVRAVNQTEYKDKCTTDTRYFISSAPLDINRLADGVRGHWGVESMHWLLDVAFKDDLSRTRAGHGAKNMATLRRFALDLVRADKSKGSVKTKRKSAGWDPAFLRKILQLK